MAPAIIAISKPPMAASTSSGAVARRCRLAAANSFSSLSCSAASSSPVPRPQASASGTPHSRESNSAAHEVLPTPTSPKAITLPGRWRTTSMPACSADTACGTDMAGLSTMLRVA